MSEATDRRISHRYTMSLPLEIRQVEGDVKAEDSQPRTAHTRDVGHRGLYFVADGEFKAGMALEVVLTLPKEVTLAGNVQFRCFARIVRVDHVEDKLGVAARIERYEILPGPM